MSAPRLETEVVDAATRANTVRRFREAGIRLPTFGELAEPSTIPADVVERLAEVDPDAADPANLFRIHWHHRPGRAAPAPLPDHLELPPSLTGVPSPIVVLLADRFPMIHAHKVLATYGCLVPRLVTGQFDPTRHKAVWPSTGNYCRGGVAVSRILGCRGVAVLPEGMSEERFRWLESWVAHPEDVIRTPGTESNVKEIYDRCAELQEEPTNVIFNQFRELGNYLAHRLVTGRALARTFEALAGERPNLVPRAFVSATGSAGTLGAGDDLKERWGTSIVAAEALECPTLSANGFGEHNIQGIGDKHVPLIHNVMATDVVVAVSDAATDDLHLALNSDAGHAHLAERKGVDEATIGGLHRLGLSSICNVLAAIKTARELDLGADDVLLTVATDGAELYATELAKYRARAYPDGFDRIAAAGAIGRHLEGAATDHVYELRHRDRRRIFDLGYYTWVEQQGVAVEEFTARRRQRWWDERVDLLPLWDERIRELNRDAGTAP